jgi:hypothetical protein
VSRPSLALPLAAFAAALAVLGGARAQEDLVPFDVPQVILPSSITIDRLVDWDGNGVVDGIGFGWLGALGSNGRFGTLRNLGNGRFELVDSFDLIGTARTWAFEAGQLDGDAFLDLAAAVGANVELRVRHDATGAQTLMTSFVETFAIEHLVLADLDRDGLDDLVVAGGTQVRAYHNDSGGAFTPLGAATTLAGSVVWLGAEDLEGDGGSREVCVVTTDDVLVFDLAPGALSLRATMPHGIAASDAPMPTAGDVDLDGDVDFVVFAETGQYACLRNLGGSGFVLEPLVTGGPATALADVDLDGDLDGICCGGSTGGGGPPPPQANNRSVFHVSIFENGAFRPAIELPSIGGKRIAGAADVDGDGDIDLVAGRTVVFNRGQTFTRPVNIDPATALVPGHGEPIDLDGDGDLDLEGAGTVFFRNTVWHNDATGRFTRSERAFPQAPPGTLFVGPGLLADFDGDADTDAIVAHVDPASGAVLGMRLLRNDLGRYADAGYAAAAGVDFHPTTDLTAFGARALCVDADGDGDFDVIAGSPPVSGAQVAVWHNDGNGNFSAGQVFAAYAPVGYEDLDGDGHADLVTNRISPFGLGALTVHFGTATGLSTIPRNVGSSASDSIGIADLDGDGRKDLVYVQTFPFPRVVVARQIATQLFLEWVAQGPELTTSLQSVRVAIDDFDGDGAPDVALGPIAAVDSTALLLNRGPDAASGTFDFEVLPIPVADVRWFDADGDGDRDGVGTWLVRDTTFDGAAAGSIRQYGAGTVGSAGVVPVLGAEGPVRVGSVAQLRIGRAVGGAPGVLFVGGVEANAPGLPLPGLTLLVDPLLTVPIQLLGTFPQPGGGSFALPLPLQASAAGLRLTLQAFLLDAGVVGLFTQTNGLELVVGS